MTGHPVLIASSDIENLKAIRAVLAEDGLSTICAATVKETQEDGKGRARQWSLKVRIVPGESDMKGELQCYF